MFGQINATLMSIRYFFKIKIINLTDPKLLNSGVYIYVCSHYTVNKHNKQNMHSEMQHMQRC